MATSINGEWRDEKDELEVELEEGETPAEPAGSAAQLLHERLPWIGSLSNPRLGPMLVMSDEGYLVPLFTAGDLLRGCRYLWRRERG